MIVKYTYGFRLIAALVLLPQSCIYFDPWVSLTLYCFVYWDEIHPVSESQICCLFSKMCIGISTVLHKESHLRDI